MKFPPAITALALWLALAMTGLSAEPPAITTVRELRALSSEDAAKGLTTRVHGVVVLVEAPRTAFIMEDGAGAPVHLKTGLPELHAGQLIEAEGTTRPGLYVPGIGTQKIRILGETALPEPRPVTFEQLASGVFNYEWVEVRGIVRSFREAPDGHGVLSLALGDGRLEVHAAAPDASVAAGLIDARVRLTGLAAGFINDRRQLVVPHLRVADLSAVQIEEAAPADPSALPLTPVEQLLGFHPEGAPGHRVRISGVVTHQQPGQAVFLRDGARGLFVETTDASEFHPGELVEALGFAEMGAFTAVLRDSTVRATGHGEAPTPITATAAEVLKGTHDADLVSLDAQLVDVLRGASEFTLLLRAGDLAFVARLGGERAAEIATLRAGSQVRLTGVARATQPEFPVSGFSARQRSFELLLRTPDDVAVLTAAPFWTSRRLGTALAFLALIAAAAFAWVVSLRRRLTAQTAIIRDQARAEAALEERERIAREFHDTLEQELVGLMLRLDAASVTVTESKPRELLDGARRLVQGVQAGARSLVWNLRQPALEVADLPAAISQTITDLREGRQIEVHTEGQPQRLPAVTEHELLRIAQEAVTNAVKHGAAAHIAVTIGFQPHEIRLRIVDNGRGFDPQRDGVKPGHFGLIGMRERMKKLGGQLSIDSTPDQGTTLEARVPLKEA